MNKEEKKQFIENFMNSITKDMLSQVDKMPIEWDGWEIRHYAAMILEREDLMSKESLKHPDRRSYRRRKNDCENDIRVLNLKL
jgi:hypothetical protein